MTTTFLTPERISYIRDKEVRGTPFTTLKDEELELCDLALAYIAEHPDCVVEDERSNARPNFLTGILAEFYRIGDSLQRLANRFRKARVSVV